MPEQKGITYFRYSRERNMSQGFYIQQIFSDIEGTNCYQYTITQFYHRSFLIYVLENKFQATKITKLIST